MLQDSTNGLLRFVVDDKLRAGIESIVLSTEFLFSSFVLMYCFGMNYSFLSREMKRVFGFNISPMVFLDWVTVNMNILIR